MRGRPPRSGYTVSREVRERIARVFGSSKAVAGFHKIRQPGLTRSHCAQKWHSKEAGSGPKGGSNSLIHINATDPPFSHKSVMRDAIRVDLDDLAGLREKAVLVCEETNALIEEHRRLAKWLNELRLMHLTEAISPASMVPDTATADARNPGSGSAHTDLRRADRQQHSLVARRLR